MEVNIHSAIQTQSMEDVGHYLKSCSSKTINVKDTNGQTPLHVAALQGMTDVVVSLIRKKAKIDAKDNIGCTPLHSAVHSSHYEVAEKLIESKANIHALTNEKNSVLCYLVQGDSDSPLRTRIIEKILPKGINKENIHKETPFTLACGFGTYTIVKLLIQHNATINQKRFVSLSKFEKI